MGQTVQCTSAEAAKLLRKLNDELTNVFSMELQSREFSAALGEDVESVRPAYDYAAVQVKIGELERRIRLLKHTINTFNLTQEVPGFDMTVDQMLVYLPQLKSRVSKLYAMQQRLPKQRERVGYGGGSQIIDYSYANYDIEAVRADYERTAEELSRAQTALDLVNTTTRLEIPAEIMQ